MKAAAMEGIDGFLNICAGVGHGRSLLGAQFVAETGVDKDATSLVGVVLIDEKTAGQHAERAFEDAHTLIGDKAVNAGILHQALRE
jgi:hypothetical protein